MALFRRLVSRLFLATGAVIGFAAVLAAFIARQLTAPRRLPLWATPADLGLSFETVTFAAQDGLPIEGWYIPAMGDLRRHGATIILVHGWTWNRLGSSAENLLSGLIGSSAVDLLRLAYNLHLEGFGVLMFDLRNHGETASAPPVTFGLREAGDLVGAASYLSERADVDEKRIGAVGFSMGANSLLYALARTRLIAAAVAVQPATPSVLSKRMASDLLGPLGFLVLPLTELFYRVSGGPPFAALRPTFAAASSDETPILFVQGEGDRWGTTEDVAQMAGNSPQARGPLFVDTIDRFGGYQYVLDNPKILSAFFEQHLPE